MFSGIPKHDRGKGKISRSCALPLREPFLSKTKKMQLWELIWGRSGLGTVEQRTLRLGGSGQLSGSHIRCLLGPLICSSFGEHPGGSSCTKEPFLASHLACPAVSPSGPRMGAQCPHRCTSGHHVHAACRGVPRTAAPHRAGAAPHRAGAGGIH